MSELLNQCFLGEDGCGNHLGNEGVVICPLLMSINRSFFTLNLREKEIERMRQLAEENPDEVRRQCVNATVYD